MSYWPRRPSLKEPDIAIEQRNAGIRRSFRTCIARLDRVESAYDRSRLNEALLQSRELVPELVRLVCLLEGIPPDESVAALKDPGRTPLLLPVGNLREDFGKLSSHVWAAEAATSESEQDVAIKAFITAGLGVVQTAKSVFQKRLLNDLRTPLDIYKRHLVLTIGKTIASITIPAAIAFAVYQMRLPRITVVEATFGGNCDGAPGALGGSTHSIRRGNATPAVSADCNNSRVRCNLSITQARYGDPAPMCAKEFTVTWFCSGDRIPHGATIAAEATGKTLSLTCGTAPRITIHEATYGANCNGKPAPNGGTYPTAKGNRTAAFARLCNLAESSCSITVGGERMADPAPMCGKEFEIVWSCSHDGKERRQRIAAEALGKTIVLSCDDKT